MSSFRARDIARRITRGLTSVYLPLDWKSAIPSLSLRQHLPIDALAHLTVPLADRLSRFLLILKTPLPPGADIPPTALMNKTYAALRQTARRLLLDRLAKDFPAPAYYLHSPRPTPHPFMGLDKFIAGRIHQMRAGKSYLAAHSSWYQDNPDDTCPRCNSSPETFEHAILHCPDKSRERARLLKAVSSLSPDSTVWSDPTLVHSLGHFIAATRTGFPPAASSSQSRSPSPDRPPLPLQHDGS